tara:strand:+ start:4092 stop:5408 length:1317 start_codon:yes stop_codon:yes gene_type:complete
MIIKKLSKYGLLILTALILSHGTAYAQFGGILKDVNKLVDEIAKIEKSKKVEEPQLEQTSRSNLNFEIVSSRRYGTEYSYLNIGRMSSQNAFCSLMNHSVFTGLAIDQWGNTATALRKIDTGLLHSWLKNKAQGMGVTERYSSEITPSSASMKAIDQLYKSCIKQVTSTEENRDAQDRINRYFDLSDYVQNGPNEWVCLAEPKIEVTERLSDDGDLIRTENVLPVPNCINASISPQARTVLMMMAFEEGAGVLMKALNRTAGIIEVEREAERAKAAEQKQTRLQAAEAERASATAKEEAENQKNERRPQIIATAVSNNRDAISAYDLKPEYLESNYNNMTLREILSVLISSPGQQVFIENSIMYGDFILVVKFDNGNMVKWGFADEYGDLSLKATNFASRDNSDPMILEFMTFNTDNAGFFAELLLNSLIEDGINAQM